MRARQRICAAVALTCYVMFVMGTTAAWATPRDKNELFSQNPPIYVENEQSTAVIPVKGYIDSAHETPKTDDLRTPYHLTVTKTVTGLISGIHEYYLRLYLDGKSYQDITFSINGAGFESRLFTDMPPGLYSIREFTTPSRSVLTTDKNSMFTVTYSPDIALPSPGGHVLTVHNHAAPREPKEEEEGTSPSPQVNDVPLDIDGAFPPHDSGENDLTVIKRVVGDVVEIENTYWLALMRDGKTVERFAFSIKGDGQATKVFVTLPPGVYSIREYTDGTYRTFLTAKNSVFTPLYSEKVNVNADTHGARLILTNSTIADYLPDDYVPVNDGELKRPPPMPFTGGMSVSLVAIPGLLLILVGWRINRKRGRRCL